MFILFFPNLPTEETRLLILTHNGTNLAESHKDEMVPHVKDNGLIRDSQHGFRKGRFCLTNLLILMDKVSRCLDSGEPVDAIFLYFDKVAHLRLARKLATRRITGEVLHWIEAWLANRKQRVCINGTLSTWLLVVSGVPQGSALGPLLFLINISDLDDGIINWILKFSNDTKIFGKVQGSAQQQQLQADLATLLQWSKDWQMLFNVKKCKVMQFGHHNQKMD